MEIRLPDFSKPRPDYGIVNLELHTDGTRRWVEVQSSDDVIGVALEMLTRLAEEGSLVEDRLTLDTAGEHVYDRMEDSVVHPHIARFRRVQRP